MGLEKFLYIKKALGKDGKQIRILKLRTMYKDADKEHLSLVSSHGLDEFGKIVDDPRVTPLGKVLRKYWIDELPQLISILNGDLSLIGIRARSKKGWSLYLESHMKEVLKYKPGLFGVKYSGNPTSFKETIKIEKEYLEQKEKDPINTDRKYFCKIMRNIFFNGVRSR